jgi:hypothetical protein
MILSSPAWGGLGAEMDSLPFIDLKAQWKKLEPELSKAMLETAASSQYILGPEVRELELALAEYVGARGGGFLSNLYFFFHGRGGGFKGGHTGFCRY